MLDETNCPHLVLGMRSDQSADQAAMHFARASRALRKGSHCPFTIEQMTSALSALENSATGDALWYSLPCDPGALALEADAYLGALRTSDDFLGAIGQSWSTPGDVSRAARAAAFHALQLVLAWRFDDAVVLARDVLRVARDDERIRDEALNVLAAAQCMLGEPAKALDALVHAADGQWNLRLQTNLAIVSTAMDPALAATQMRFLIDGAPDAEAKLRACRRAINLWRTTQEDLTGSDDLDDHEPLPPELLESIHKVLAQGDITEADYFEIGVFLASVDGARLVTLPHFARSPLRDSPSGRLLRHRSEGFFEYHEHLVEITRAYGANRPWLVGEVESWVVQVNSLAMSDPDSDAAKALAISYLDQGLDCSTIPRVLLRAVVVQNLCRQLHAENRVPAERFITVMAQARAALPGLLPIGSDADGARALRDIVDTACGYLGAIYHDNVAHQLNDVRPILATIEHRMGGILRRMSVDRSQVALICREVLDVTGSMKAVLHDLIPLVNDEELRSGLRQLLDTASNFETIARQYS